MNMLYEIGWSTYDLRHIIILLFFIPLLIIFIIFQKKYNTATEDIDSVKIPKTSLVMYRASKSNFKFMLSLLLIFLMLVSLSTILTLNIKLRAINCYRNGNYEIFTGKAIIYDSKLCYLKNETDIFGLERITGEVKDILDKDINEEDTYTIYYTKETKKNMPEIILRIDKQ